MLKYLNVSNSECKVLKRTVARTIKYFNYLKNETHYSYFHKLSHNLILNQVFTITNYLGLLIKSNLLAKVNTSKTLVYLVPIVTYD